MPKTIITRLLFNKIVKNNSSQQSKDLHIKKLTDYIFWVHEYPDRYDFLGGWDQKVLMVDNSNNKMKEIKGIGEWTWSAILVKDELIIGGEDHMFFINPNTLTINNQIKHN